MYALNLDRILKYTDGFEMRVWGLAIGLLY
jgi:hypothetical protein